MRQAGNLLIREHASWRFGHEDIKSARAMQARIDTADRHFQQLRHLGMRIVTHATVVNDNDEWPVNPHANDGLTVVSYSASAYIPNLMPLDAPDALTTVPKAHVERVIFDPIRKYMEWGNSTGEPILLFDLFTADQYSWHEDMGVVFLHDIDPHLGPREEIADVMEQDLEDFFTPIG